MLRLRTCHFDADTASVYCIGDSASMKTKGKYAVFSFEANYEDDDWMEADGLLASLIPLRSEIMNGDLRCLYLAWLLCIQNGEVDDDEVEPYVPADLDVLSASDTSFADFFRIDDDLIEVAARNSFRSPKMDDNNEALKSWIHNLPEEEKDEIIALVMTDEAYAAAEMRHRFARDTDGRKKKQEKSRRTAGELLRAAEELALEKSRQAAAKAAAEKKRREEELAAERKKYLQALAGKEKAIRLKIESLISAKQPSRYDEAVKLLVDLRDLAESRGTNEEFSIFVQTLYREHEKKPSLLRKIRAAL
jgi:hypothetical protein